MRRSACHVWHLKLHHMLALHTATVTVWCLISYPPRVHAALSNGALRMVNTGRTRFGGRLEFYYNNEWGTVCGDIWNSSDASVACRQLGFLGVRDGDSSRFGAGTSSQHIWLYDVECNGSESRLIDCSHASIGFDNCDHSEDVGITCIYGEMGDSIYIRT